MPTPRYPVKGLLLVVALHLVEITQLSTILLFGMGCLSFVPGGESSLLLRSWVLQICSVFVKPFQRCLLVCACKGALLEAKVRKTQVMTRYSA